jgi:microcystin-dependent protein
MSYIGSKRSSSLVSFDEGTIGSGVVFPTFVGMIASFATSSFTDESGVVTGAPTGWIVCNGAEYAIADYEDLHTAIGTTWGALTNGSGGPGSTYFRVPDLQGAFLRGAGTGSINGRNKTGTLNSVGEFNEDQFQGHHHKAVSQSNLLASGSSQDRTGIDVHGIFPGYDGVDDPTTDGVNGSPRFGLETFPYNASVQYCIKY